jgi:hypothetical protein
MRPATAVTVLYRSRQLLPELAETLAELRPLCDILLVDSCSGDGTAGAAARAVPWARLVRAESNLGFGAANNLALPLVETPFILLLNPDARLGLDALSGMLGFLRDHDGSTACQPLLRLWEWPSAVAGAGTSMTEYGEGYDLRYMHHLPEPPQVDCMRVPGVTAALSLWRTEALRDCGGFDPSFFMYYEDVDLCMRAASRGGRFHLLPRLAGLHRSGATSDRAEARQWELESAVLMARRYLGNGSLPARWLRREARIQASMLARGRWPLWRTAAMARAMRRRVEPVDTGIEQRSLLRSRPLDFPLPRGGWRGPLSADGALRAGPGWERVGGGLLLPGQWAGMVLPQDGAAEVSLALSSTASYLSGVYGSEGEVLGRFSLPRGKTRLSLRIPAGSCRAFLALDGRPGGGELVLEEARLR